MSEEINQDRRHFLGTAAMTMAAAQFGIIGAAHAQSSTTPPADLPTMKFLRGSAAQRPECIPGT